MCSDYEAYGSKKHGLTRSDCIIIISLKALILQLMTKIELKFTLIFYTSQNIWHDLHRESLCLSHHKVPC